MIGLDTHAAFFRILDFLKTDDATGRANALEAVGTLLTANGWPLERARTVHSRTNEYLTILSPPIVRPDGEWWPFSLSNGQIGYATYFDDCSIGTVMPANGNTWIARIDDEALDENGDMKLFDRLDKAIFAVEWVMFSAELEGAKSPTK